MYEKLFSFRSCVEKTKRVAIWKSKTIIDMSLLCTNREYKYKMLYLKLYGRLIKKCIWLTIPKLS